MYSGDGRVTSVIREYAENYENYFPPYLQKRRFRMSSHYRWACEELMWRTMGKSLEDSILIVKDFQEAMRDYEGRNRYNYLMFAVGDHVSGDILEILRAMM